MFLAHTSGNTATLFILSFATEVPGGVGSSPIFRNTKLSRDKFARNVSRY